LRHHSTISSLSHRVSAFSGVPELYGPHRVLHSFPTRRSSDLTYVRTTLNAFTRKPNNINSDEGCVTVSDSMGNLLYYAGGNANSDRKSTRLNSSHVKISYAVFCSKKKRHRSGRHGLPGMWRRE